MLARSREGGGVPLSLLLLVLLLLEGSWGMQQASYEQQRYDGWYNNLAHPAWGTVDSHLVRKTPPSYADGVYMMSGGDRPSPRNLSQASRWRVVAMSILIFSGEHGQTVVAPAKLWQHGVSTIHS